MCINDSRFPTGGELEACKDINITLEKGQSLGIVGESGSGKTTLVRMIMKMLPITEGEIYVDGVEIQHMNSEQTKEYRKKNSNGIPRSIGSV